ncbi:MAG: hypothetical protein ACPG5P_03035, partial [Saprospiraceae bacterium]
HPYREFGNFSSFHLLGMEQKRRKYPLVLEKMFYEKTLDKEGNRLKNHCNIYFTFSKIFIFLGLSSFENQTKTI